MVPRNSLSLYPFFYFRHVTPKLLHGHNFISVSSCILSRLRYPILFQLVLLLLSLVLRAALSAIAGNLVFGGFLAFILPFQLYHVSFCLEWVHSQVCS